MRRRPLLATACTALAVLGLTAAAGSAPAAAQAKEQGWAKYVVAPTSRNVKPVGITATSGDVTNPAGALGHGTVTLRRDQAPARPTWPDGTTATASSFHAPNNGNDGTPRTYDPGNAVDGNVDSFWNDDTLGAYPDVLTIKTTAAQPLDGITVLSNSDGVPEDYTVDTLDADGTTWQPAGQRHRQHRGHAPGAVRRDGLHDAGADHHHPGPGIRPR